MMKLFKLFILPVLFAGLQLLAAAPAQAQDHEVTGRVIDEESETPLPGVNVLVKGTEIGATTDGDGRYEISAPSEQDTLIFSFVGYTDETVPIQGRAVVDVEMGQSVSALDEIVVVGYGEQEEATVSGAVSEIESEQLTETPVANATELLAGATSGLITRQTSGAPGQDFTNFSIRGFGNPLVLVDGVAGRDLTRLDPNDIASISVLKDASAAVYGARAANGVILVETKRGQRGKPEISYQADVSLQQPTVVPERVDAGQYTELFREGKLNYGLEPRYSEEDVQKYKQEAGPQYQSYDWYDALAQNWAPMQKHNLSVNGGSDNVRYYASAGFLDQTGIFESGDLAFRRYNARSNLDADITDSLTVSLNLSYRRENREEPGANLNEFWNQYSTASPLQRPTLPNGKPAWSGFTNRAPLSATQRGVSGFQEDTREAFNGSLELSYEMPFVRGLTSSARLAYVFRSQYVKDLNRSYEVFSYDAEADEYTSRGTAGSSSLGENFDRYQKLYPRVELDYARTFGNHSVEGLALAEWISEEGLGIGTSRDNLLSDDLPYLFVGSTENIDNYSNATDEGRTSFVGRLKYDYADKYIIEGAVRADASHKFPENSRWGYFPSVSAAWRLSEEPFLRDNVDFLENLKLRASFSKTGDDRDIAPFQYLTGFNIRQGDSYIVDNSVGRVITPTGLPNPDITWLEATQYNAGLDASFWAGRLSFTTNAFYRRVDNIFGTPQRQFPSTFGASLPQLNINATTDRGVEFTLSHENRLGDFNYSVSSNFTYAVEKYADWAEESFEDEDVRRLNKLEGNRVGRIIGYVSDGLFNSQEEIDNYEVDQDQAGNSTLRPGDIKYKDLNGDGEITFRDQRVIGKGFSPDMTYGINLDASYKGVSLSMLWQGASMYSLYPQTNAQGTFRNFKTPLKYMYEHRWTPDNKDARFPAANTTGNAPNANNAKVSDFWVRDGTYIRLKRLNLGYRIPQRWIDPAGLRRLRLYVSGSNLLTFDQLGIFSGYFDPEDGLSVQSYPPVRTVSVGVNLGI
jgi:TonB-linked SusC/RagA family outer membrane protein